MNSLIHILYIKYLPLLLGHFLITSESNSNQLDKTHLEKKPITKLAQRYCSKSLHD